MKTVLLLILYPLSLLYRIVIALRNLFFDLGIFSQNRVDATVISVGNLSVGGTGKTPFVLYLIDLLSSSEKKIAVLTRGYGRSSSSPIFCLPSEELSDWKDSGDEPFLLKKRVENLTISVDSKRIRGAAEAIEKAGSELILLDDGFQHRAINRDLDIVIIEDPKSFENRSVIPAGRLREPLNSLKRADIVVFMGSETDSAGIRKYLSSETVLCGGLKEPDALFKVNSDEELDLSELSGKKLTAFCGIGNPDGFRSTLNSFNPALLELLEFPDHHNYTLSDLEKIRKSYVSSNSDFLITTEKDGFKLPSDFFSDIDLNILRIAFKIMWNKDKFDKKISEIIRSE